MIPPRRFVGELAAAWVSGLDKQIRCGPGAVVLRQSSGLCWKRGERGAVSADCVHPVFSTSACTWAPAVTGRSGRQTLRIRGLTAGREFQAWVARESLRRGGCLLGCRGLPPWNGRVVLPPEPFRRPQDLAGQGDGTGSPGSRRNRSAWRPGTPPPCGFVLAGWVISGRCVSPREARHFSQRGCHAAAALSRSPARSPRHLVPEGALASLSGRLGRVPVAYGCVRDRGARHPGCLAFTHRALTHRFSPPCFVILCLVIRACGVSPGHHPPPEAHRLCGPPGSATAVAARGPPPFPGRSAMRGTSFFAATPRRRESGRPL